MTVTTPGGRPVATTRMPRVALLAEQRLVAETVSVALTSRGVEAVVVGWGRSRRRDPQLRRRISATQPRAGIVLAGSMRGHDRRELVRDVFAVPVPWLLVVDDPALPVWGSVMESGVALLPGSVGLDELAGALLRTMSGQDIMLPGTRQRLVGEWRRLDRRQRQAAERIALLSPRERAVLDQLYEGVAVGVIAEESGLSEATIRSQVKSLMRKLNVRSQLQAVAVYRHILENGAGGRPTPDDDPDDRPVPRVGAVIGPAAG